MGIGSAATFEIMGTFFLMFIVCETAVNVQSIATPSSKGTMSAGFAPSGANVAPVAIGFAVFLAHCVGIPLTGCGINPVVQCLNQLNVFCSDFTIKQ